VGVERRRGEKADYIKKNPTGKKLSDQKEHLLTRIPPSFPGDLRTQNKIYFVGEQSSSSTAEESWEGELKLKNRTFRLLAGFDRFD
jgi:hypothetical protein